MNTVQENKLSMYLTVSDYATANTTTFNALPNALGYITTLKNTINSIHATSELQMLDKKGITISKNQLRTTVIILAIDTSRKVSAYARYANNQLLLSEIAHTETELKRLPDSTLQDMAQGIYNKAQSNLTSLSSYGVTAATQTALQSAITGFIASIPKPRVGVIDIKQQTLQLEGLYKAADATLKNLDSLVEISRMSNPAFYSGYKMARRTIKMSNGSLSVKCRMYDELTNSPIKGVNAIFININKALKLKPIVKKSAEKGGIMIKNMPIGSYNVIFKKLGYKDVEVTLNVNEGEMSRLDVGMGKSL